MRKTDLPRSVLERRALIYVRQSTLAQVEQNLESQRRQYELGDVARSLGFREVDVIDDDLGRSASGTAARPGFDALVSQVCQGTVGAVFCLEASRLARNGRDWHHLLELCGLVGTYVVDGEGVYDPGRPNDRLLLGMKGTMSEFELTLIRQRLVDGAMAKASRGELRISVPVGFVWEHGGVAELDPDRRVQDAVHRIFRLFERLGSARRVHRYLCENELSFPRPMNGKHRAELRWARPSYRNVISVIRNPFYAGAYAYGKSAVRTTVVDGRLRKSYGHDRPIEDWDVLLHDHHEGYIDWATFERNQERLARNTFSKKAGSPKSGRGGRALLSGLLRCRRCGRMLNVAYVGRGRGLVRYHCRIGETHGVAKCISFGGARPDALVASLLLDAVQPMAIEAAQMAHEQIQENHDERVRAAELEVEQARYAVQLARRRYEAVDPDNRLVAVELEARWNRALQELQDCEKRQRQASADVPSVDHGKLAALADDLRLMWNATNSDMQMKQRLVRTLIEEIVVDVDDATREVVILVHWKGGQHSEHRVRKPRSGEHRRRTSLEAGALIREMAGRWSDEHIAASLNRLGHATGQGNSWNAARVRSYRAKQGIRAYDSAHKASGEYLTLSEAASRELVSHYAIRKLLKAGILPARQVMKDAPWQILADHLALPEVQTALDRHRSGRKDPCRSRRDNRTLTIPGT